MNGPEHLDQSVNPTLFPEPLIVYRQGPVTSVPPHRCNFANGNNPKYNFRYCWRIDFGFNAGAPHDAVLRLDVGDVLASGLNRDPALEIDSVQSSPNGNYQQFVFDGVDSLSVKISARTSYPSLLQVINNGGKVIRTSNLIIFGRLHGCVENLGLEYFADTFKENPSAIEFLKKTFPLTDNIEMNIGGTANYVVKPFHMMTPLVQMRSALSVVEGQDGDTYPPSKTMLWYYEWRAALSPTVVNGKRDIDLFFTYVWPKLTRPDFFWGCR